MAGLYVHIPFCRKACTYCDFHFSTSLKSREALLDAMRREVGANAQRRSQHRWARSTSVVARRACSHRRRSLCSCTKAKQLFIVEPNAEVTLEANPDDINQESLLKWKELGITRISLGTQSFRDDRLRFMGRAHDADQAIRSIDLIAKAGFASWTIDLIYGLPKMTLAEWEEQLTIALDHGMPHLSAYCLTMEPRTALAHQVAKGLVHMPADDDQSAQFDRLMDRMDTAGLDHYEISNFGKPGHWSRHNTAYWEGVPYLGIGPSAHSFNGRERRWNVSNNAQYMTALSKGEPYWELELLTAAQRTNEALLTGLRTSAGVPIARLELDVIGRNSSDIERYVSSGHLLLVDGRLVLTKAGRHFADRIAADLFVSDDAG